MQSTLALAALAAVALGAPTEPSVKAPEGCSANYDGEFQITAVNSAILTRDLHKRTCGAPGSLVITLADGKLHDANGRTAYIASSYQFQFDDPPQVNALSTGGYSVCNNGSLALGSSAIFYECLSGSFYNLYDRYWAPQCEPILIEVLPCGSGSGNVGEGSDGQATGTGIATITQITDGQPQAPTGVPISEISDGQPQVPTGAPAPPITQISDGQPQAPAPTGGAPPPITQISDGQPQAPAPTGVSPPPITQISDGQPQAPAPTGGSPPPITQISDGQPQAPVPTGSGRPTGGAPGASGPGGGAPGGSQIPAPTGTQTGPGSPSSTPTQTPVAPNAGNTLTGGAYLVAAVAGLVGAALL